MYQQQWICTFKSSANTFFRRTLLTVSTTTRPVSSTSTNNVMKKACHGSNSIRTGRYGCSCGTHAEVSAMHRIARGKYTRRKFWETTMKMNLLVVRFGKGGELRMSKPCWHCIKVLGSNRTFIIKKIYYSNEDGNIVSTTLDQLMTEVKDGTAYITKGYKR